LELELREKIEDLISVLYNNFTVIVAASKGSNYAIKTDHLSELVSERERERISNVRMAKTQTEKKKINKKSRRPGLILLYRIVKSSTKWQLLLQYYSS